MCAITDKGINQTRLMRGSITFFSLKRRCFCKKEEKHSDQACFFFALLRHGVSLRFAGAMREEYSQNENAREVKRPVSEAISAQSARISVRTMVPRTAGRCSAFMRMELRCVSAVGRWQLRVSSAIPAQRMRSCRTNGGWSCWAVVSSENVMVRYVSGLRYGMRKARNSNVLRRTGARSMMTYSGRTKRVVVELP